MLKALLVFSALLPLGLAPQQPAAQPAPSTQSAPAATQTAPAAAQTAPAAAQTAPAAQTAIPAEAAHMVNPVKPTPESQAHAKKMYGYDCAMCHGANGNGKGDVAAEMNVTLKNYTDPAALKGMSDGELFYIIKNGKDQMPGEGDRAKPEELWNLVILVRSFAKK